MIAASARKGVIVSLERLARFAPLTGVAAVVFWVIGIFIIESGNTPGDDAPAAELATYFENEEVSIYLGGFALMIGSLLLIWFAGSLRASLAAAEGGVARLATIVFGAAVTKAVFDIAFFSGQIAGAFAANESKAPLTPEAAQALWFAGDGFFVAAEYASALLLTATGVAILRTRILPVWLAWVAFLLAIVALIPPIGWAELIFAFPIWLIVVSVLLYLRTPAEASGRGAAAPA
jgi:hypothetical protein